MDKAEAIKILRELHDKVLFSERTALETLHPELKESEDEKVRNKLIEFFKGYSPDEKWWGNITQEDILAWLEKQTEVESNNDDIEVEEKDIRKAFNKIWDEKQGTYTKRDVDDAFVEGMALAKNELEKQGEKKSSDEVLKIRQELYQSGYNDGYKHGCEDTKKQGEQKSAEWSEEDERIRQCLIQDQEEALDDVYNDKYGHSEIISDLKEMYHERIDWLKSIKERYTWKPKTWDIQILESVIDGGENPKKYSATLHGILEQLKKLKGE